MAISDLSRFEQFLAIPVEDIQGRAVIAITDAEVEELHALFVKGEVAKDFYYQVSSARTADEIYLHQGKECGWSIAFIRENQRRTEYRRYSKGGEDVCEWISWRLWPTGKYIERIRSNKEPVRIIQEVELAFSPEADLEGLWEQYRPGLEVWGLELLQRFPDNKFVQDMCFLPGEPNFVVRFVISAGEQRKELTFPIALRYEPLLRKTAKKYRFDVSEAEPQYSEPLQRASTEELQVALVGLWTASKNYDKTKGSIPAYMKQRTEWHMGEEFGERSVEIEEPETGKREPVLKSRLERTGGSLDDPRVGKDGIETGPLSDTIADPQTGPPDQRILLEQILSSLVDETDKQIVHLCREEHTQEEIAQKLGITQPAIAKRLRRIGKKLGH